MTTKDMIEVMQHYDNGGEVECRYKNQINKEEFWISISAPIWNWTTYDYRIKPKSKKTKTVWFWRVKIHNEWFLTNNMHTEEEARNIWPKALEYKCMDMLGSEEVEV